MKLIKVINLIDDYSQLIGEGQITVTSALRVNSAGYHSKAQAVDIRTHDKSAKWLLSMRTLYGILKVDPQIQFDFHEELIGTPNAHLHVEIDDGSL